MMPAPYASPKCGNEAGETTSISVPASRRRSTASATKRPAVSASERGYDVARTTTFTRSRCRRPKTTGSASASIARA